MRLKEEDHTHRVLGNKVVQEAEISWAQHRWKTNIADDSHNFKWNFIKW